jgi:small subunit ribosomal protein S1
MEGQIVTTLLGFGGWGLLAAVLFFVFAQPEKVDTWRGKILWLFSWIGVRLRRNAVRAELQGAINGFSREANKESPGLAPYNMKIQFVNEVDRSELIENDTVLVRIRDRKYDDKNLVHAMLAFCPIGVIPSARPFLPDSLSLALDFTITRKLLNKMKHYSALEYLYNKVLSGEIEREPELQQHCERMDRLDDHGLFTRVVVRELIDFGASCADRFPSEIHRREPLGLLDYLDSVVSREPGVDMKETAYQGRYISVGFVFVGSSYKMASEGERPYLNHIRRLKGDGVIKAYIVARGANVQAAELIADSAERQGLGKTVTRARYVATDRKGTPGAHVIVEFDLAPPQTLAASDELSPSNSAAPGIEVPPRSRPPVGR